MPKRAVSSAVDPVIALAERLAELENRVDQIHGWGSLKDRVASLENKTADLNTRIGSAEGSSAPLGQRVSRLENTSLGVNSVVRDTVFNEWLENPPPYSLEKLRELTKPEDKPRRWIPLIRAAIIAGFIALLIVTYYQYRPKPVSSVSPYLSESDLLSEAWMTDDLLPVAHGTSSEIVAPLSIVDVGIQGFSTCEGHPENCIGSAQQIIITNTEPRDCWVGRGKEHTTLHGNDTWQLPPFDHPVTIRNGCPGALTYSVDGKLVHPVNKAKNPNNVEVVELP